MTDYSKLPDLPVPDVPEADQDMPEQGADYEWAEYNLPVTAIVRRLLREESGDELAFVGLAVEVDPQPFENS